jgi:hypothetical protein
MSKAQLAICAHLACELKQDDKQAFVLLNFASHAFVVGYRRFGKTYWSYFHTHTVHRDNIKVFYLLTDTQLIFPKKQF